MKKTFRIFIAGSKALEGERDALKALAHDLNTGYEDKRASIKVEVKSYENFKDNQRVYNHFIEKNADLVLFVLEGRPGEKTQEEFVKAATSYKSKKRPEIIIFIQETAYCDKEIMKDIDEIVKPYLGDHYAGDYTDLSNLKAKAKQKIDQFITPSLNLMQTIRQWSISILSVLCILFAGLFVWANFFKKPAENNPMSILFAGGGSVVNFLKDDFSLNPNDTLDVTDYPGAIYANMPSGNAWALIPEEFNRYIKAGKDVTKLPFRTVCVSASRACLDDFTKTCDPNEFFSNASVVECYLGEDPLVVYVEKKGSETIIKQEWRDSMKITPKDLAFLINQTDVFNVFTTSPNSGTCNTYEKILHSEDSTKFEARIKNNLAWSYNEASNLGVFKIDESDNDCRPYIVLGSKNYFSLALSESEKPKKERSYYEFNICDPKTHQPFTKSMYLYFMAIQYPDGKSAVIPTPIYNFLNKTKIANTDRWKNMVKEVVVEENGKKETKYLIYPYSKLIQLTAKPEEKSK